MFKLAALTATISAASIVQDAEHTIDMFKVTLKEKELDDLQNKERQYFYRLRDYDRQFSRQPDLKQFQSEFKALAQTNEFVNLSRYVQQIDRSSLSPQIRAFAEIYKKELRKLDYMQRQIERSSSRPEKMSGERGNRVGTFNVDNDRWYELNREYYKIRELQYYAMYKIPEVVKLRAKVTDLRHTAEMGKIQQHWKQFALEDEQQDLLKLQADYLMAMIKVVHISEQDKVWTDPRFSPIMFEAWHAVYIYFVAMGQGNLEPLLDFVIDGKYDPTFVKQVDPIFQVDEPLEKNLYLY